MAKTKRYTPYKTDQITHSTDGEVGHYVHVVGMNCINGASPVIYGAPVRVENGEVEGRITWDELDTRKVKEDR